MRPATDQELVALASSGDTSSFGQLFERYQERIFNYIYRVAGNAEDAADITQDAFVKVFEKLPAKQPDNFSAYLYRTAHNTAMDALRSRSRLTDDAALEIAEDPSLYADPERAALFREQQAQVWQATAVLSTDQRAVLTLRELQELSYQEIADVLEMPRNTVGVQLSRARLKLKGAFRMQNVDAEKLSKECQAMLPLLSALIDDELTAAERVRVEAHLEDCPLCRLALEDMTEASKSYRALIPLLPPLAIKAGVFESLGVSAEAAASVTQVPEVIEAAEEIAPAGEVSPLSESPTGPASGETPTGTGGLGGGGGQPLVVKAALTLATTALLAVGVLAAMWFAGGSQQLSLDLPFGLGPTAEVVGESRIAEDARVGEPTPSYREQAEVEIEEPPVVGGIPAPVQVFPHDGYQTSQRDITLEWKPVDFPYPVTYDLEVRRYLPKQQIWDDYLDYRGLSETTLDIELDSYALYMWRVWAWDENGIRSDLSPWWEFERIVIIY